MTALNLTIRPCCCVDFPEACSKVFIDGLTRDGRFEPEVAAQIIGALNVVEPSRELAAFLAESMERRSVNSLALEPKLTRLLGAFDGRVGVRARLEDAFHAAELRHRDKQIAQLVKDATPAAQVERWKKLEENARKALRLLEDVEQFGPDSNTTDRARKCLEEAVES